MRHLSAWIILTSLAISQSLPAAPLGSAFTYQGKVEQGGLPVTGLCDFNFSLWDASAGGAEVATAIAVAGVLVTDGIFTVELDYGHGAFAGDARWLEIAVACPPGGGLTSLAPRQALTPAPHALFAAAAGSMGSAGTLDDAYDHGGAGAGRFITADAGAVTVTGIGGTALSVIADFNPTLRVSSNSTLGQDTGIEIVGARNGTTDVDAAFLDLRDFDNNEGAGTEFSMARIGAGMQDASGQTGFLRFYTNAGADLQERMRIDKQGAVSIGSESGTERLKVAGDVAIGGGTAIGLDDGNSEYLRIRGRVDDWYLGVRDAPTGPEHDFFIGLNDQDFTRFNFDRSGNLGLGTEPAADLHLASTGSQQIRVEADTDNSGESDQPSLVLTQDGGIVSGSFGFFDSSNNLSIRALDSGGGASHLLLEPEGRVGVGTASPQNRLDVQGPGTTVGGGSSPLVVARFTNETADSPTGISIDSLAGEDSLLYFSEDGSAEWNIRLDYDHPDFTHPTLVIQRYRDEGLRTALRLVANHSDTGFGIFPGGDDNTLLGGSSGGAWANVTTYSLTNLSDARLKSDVRDLDYGIDDINRLRPVRFRWSTRPEDGDTFGVIAQEVADVMPELVDSEPEDPKGRMVVNYLSLIPVLIKGIQDQQRQIDELSAEVQRLEAVVMRSE